MKEKKKESKKLLYVAIIFLISFLATIIVLYVFGFITKGMFIWIVLALAIISIVLIFAKSEKLRNWVLNIFSKQTFGEREHNPSIIAKWVIESYSINWGKNVIVEFIQGYYPNLKSGEDKRYIFEITDEDTNEREVIDAPASRGKKAIIEADFNREINYPKRFNESLRKRVSPKEATDDFIEIMKQEKPGQYLELLAEKRMKESNGKETEEEETEENE